MNYVFAALAAALVSGAALNASAQVATVTFDRQGERQVVVSYADLDIGTPAGAAVLVTRVRAAVESVCGPRPPTALDLVAVQDFEDCRRASADSALRQLQARRITLAGLEPAAAWRTW